MVAQRWPFWTNLIGVFLGSELESFLTTDACHKNDSLLSLVMIPVTFSTKFFHQASLSEIELKPPSLLPVSVVPLILHFLSVEKIFSKIVLVCRNWNQTVRSDRFISQLIHVALPNEISQRFSIGFDAFYWLKRSYFTVWDLEFLCEGVLHVMQPSIVTNLTRIDTMERGEGMPSLDSGHFTSSLTTTSSSPQYGTAILYTHIRKGRHLYVFQLFVDDNSHAFIANPFFALAPLLSAHALTVDASEFSDVALVYGAGIGLFRNGHAESSASSKRRHIKNKDVVCVLVDFESSRRVFFALNGELACSASIEELERQTSMQSIGSRFVSRQRATNHNAARHNNESPEPEYCIAVSLGAETTIAAQKHVPLTERDVTNDLPSILMRYGRDD